MIIQVTLKSLNVLFLFLFFHFLIKKFLSIIDADYQLFCEIGQKKNSIKLASLFGNKMSVILAYNMLIGKVMNQLLLTVMV